jgi:hypothetical protein
MVRLFTIPFTYQEQTYSAIVSITGVDGSTTVNIVLPDESLHHILPEGKFSFNAQEGMLLNYPRFSAAQDLLIAVLVAIEEYNRQNQHSPKLQQK